MMVNMELDRGDYLIKSNNIYYVVIGDEDVIVAQEYYKGRRDSTKKLDELNDVELIIKKY